MNESAESICEDLTKKRTEEIRREVLPLAKKIATELDNAIKAYWRTELEYPDLYKIIEKYDLSKDLIEEILYIELGKPESVVSEEEVINAAIKLGYTPNINEFDEKRTRDGKLWLSLSGFLEFVHKDGTYIAFMSGFDGKLWLYKNALGINSELDRLWKHASEMAHTHTDLIVEEVVLSLEEMDRMELSGLKKYYLSKK